MKRRNFVLWALALILALAPVCAHAAAGLEEAVSGSCAYSRGEAGLQEWLDGALCAGAGGPTDNNVLALCRLNSGLDFSNYVRAASERLNAGDITNPVSRQRCALALLACDAGAQVPDALVDETAGKLGVMSIIYGLHLLNNGASSALWSRDALSEKLLSLQKADGGWSVMGDYGDVDVTAMCLQALACPDASAPVSVAVERGLGFLSECQLESAGFSSMGKENAESCAQVLLALSSLGVDFRVDARFLKRGRNPLDALLEYRCPSGGFSHLPGEGENETATVQVFQALVALMNESVRFYDFSTAPTAALPAAQAAEGPGWKLWALCAIGALVLAGAIYALTRKRSRTKRLLFVLVAGALAAAAVFALNVESASEYYSEKDTGDRHPSGSAYLSIRCDTVAGRAEDGSTPEDGVILPRTVFPICEGDSVFDLLTAAARQYHIQMEHEGGEGDMAYVNGINYLYEYAYGELSGWIYSVNAVTPSIGCGSYILEDGDEVLWQYTTDLGEDLK